MKSVWRLAHKAISTTTSISTLTSEPSSTSKARSGRGILLTTTPASLRRLLLAEVAAVEEVAVEGIAAAAVAEAAVAEG